ncbi:MAG: hypothetical protein QM526_02060 [Alphaproteobacteria bacterium]|nr:hypothetical protein [Alphaproteobacteria bacterium]
MNKIFTIGTNVRIHKDNERAIVQYFDTLLETFLSSAKVSSLHELFEKNFTVENYSPEDKTLELISEDKAKITIPSQWAFNYKINGATRLSDEQFDQALTRLENELAKAAMDSSDEDTNASNPSNGTISALEKELTNLEKEIADLQKQITTPKTNTPQKNDSTSTQEDYFALIEKQLSSLEKDVQNHLKEQNRMTDTSTDGMHTTPMPHVGTKKMSFEESLAKLKEELAILNKKEN